MCLSFCPQVGGGRVPNRVQVPAIICTQTQPSTSLHRDRLTGNTFNLFSYEARMVRKKVAAILEITTIYSFGKGDLRQQEFHVFFHRTVEPKRTTIQKRRKSLQSLTEMNVQDRLKSYIGGFPKCFTESVTKNITIFKRLFEPATCCVRDQNATTVLARHK